MCQCTGLRLSIVSLILTTRRDGKAASQADAVTSSAILLGRDFGDLQPLERVSIGYSDIDLITS